MAGKPVATIGSMHVCPMVTGYIPHVGGPVSGPGMPGVTINGQPIAVMGDMCTCVGPPDTIVQGCPGVTVNGKPVATMGSMTAHGGQITVGVPGVTVGPNTPTPDAVMPLKKIPFPKISLLDIVGAFVVGKSQSLTSAQKNQAQLESEAEDQDGIKKITNVRWVDENGKLLRDEKLQGKLYVSADVRGFEDGEEITFSVCRKTREGEVLKELKGKVKDGAVRVEWLAEKESFTTEQ